jgi:uncharacterized protein with FMN-binding domain
MNRIQKGITIVLLLSVIGGASYLYSYVSQLNEYKNIVAALKIGEIDLQQVKDGIYQGSCDARLVAAHVSVTVKDHKITDIALLQHKNEKGQQAEVLPQMVVKAQSLKVDTISGATNSSKVILKATENALKQGTDGIAR